GASERLVRGVGQEGHQSIEGIGDVVCLDAVRLCCLPGQVGALALVDLTNQALDHLGDLVAVIEQLLARLFDDAVGVRDVIRTHSYSSSNLVTTKTRRNSVSNAVDALPLCLVARDRLVQAVLQLLDHSIEITLNPLHLPLPGLEDVVDSGDQLAAVVADQVTLDSVLSLRDQPV